jgi:type VI secretion system Hcp family effector
MRFGKMSDGMSNWLASSAGRKTAMIALGVVASAALATGARAQDAAFIRVVGAKGAIAGTAKDSAHQGWIAVSKTENLPTPEEVSRESSSPSVSEVTATAVKGKTEATPSTKNATADAPRDLATGQTSGKRAHQAITIWKEVDAASPLLKEMQTKGERLQEVDIQMSAKPGQAALTYKLSDVMISALSTSGGTGAGAGKVSAQSGGSDRPVESISFTYQKIEMTR